MNATEAKQSAGVKDKAGCGLRRVALRSGRGIGRLALFQNKEGFKRRLRK